jgi:filamentous hemagglutinin family protein
MMRAGEEMLTAARPVASRRRLVARTALCCALGALAAPALALPAGGEAQVNVGGGLPVIASTATRMDVTLNAPRTVLNWTGYDVLPTETVSYAFGARNWIVLNRMAGLSDIKIEGVVEGRVGGAYGGNIWFASQNSIVFGKGARVDAGGILAGIGAPDVASFLDTSRTELSFSGSDVLPGSRVWVLSDAAITAHGGMVLLAGPSLVTRANATVTAAEGDVVYGVAKTFQVRLAPGTSGDFELVDFVVPDLSAGTDDPTLADLAGATNARTVYLAAVNKSAVAGAVINLEGMITAQSATTDGGDIILSGGGGIANRLAGPTIAGTEPTGMYLVRASAGRDLQVRQVGRIVARPWARPPDAAVDPVAIADEPKPPPEQPPCEQSCTGGAPVEESGPFAAGQTDPTAVSVVSVGRDALISATGDAEVGRLVANRDVAIDGGGFKANVLVATGNLTVRSSIGDIRISEVAVARDGLIDAKADVAIDAITAPQKLAVTAGRNIALGNGLSDVAGAVTLAAVGSVSLNLGSARIDSVTAGGDVYAFATSGDAVIGSATSGDDVYVVSAHGTASLGSATLTGAGPDVANPDFQGVPDVAGNGRVVHVEATAGNALLGLGTGSVNGATQVEVRAGLDAAVDVLAESSGKVQVTAGQDATLKAPVVRLDAVTAGRDLTVGSTTGDFTVAQTLVAARNITVSAAGALRVADVRADAGSVSLIGASVTAGAVSASEDLTLKALSGAVTTASYRAGRDFTVQGLTLNLGSAIVPVLRDLSITSLGNFTSSTPLSAGRNLTVVVAGKAVLGTANAANVRIAANDLDLTGLVTAPSIQIESQPGAIQVGGAGRSGFVLDGADFSRLRASSQLRIYAGATTGTARGDLTLQALTIDPAATPNVVFLVGSSANARVQGTVAPTSSGGIVRIGDAADLTWRPDSILITGSLGAATFAGDAYSNVRAFDEVRLAARQDIIMGSQRFIGLIQTTAAGAIDISAGLPDGVAPTPDEQSKVFVAAGRLEVSAENKVVQQNAVAPDSGQSVGLLFTGQFNPVLLIDPPKIVDLFGAVTDRNGNVVTGAAARSAFTFAVVDANGQPIPPPPGSVYRFNSCDVGQASCAFGSTGGGAPGSAESSPGIIGRDALNEGGGGLELTGDPELVDPSALPSPPDVLTVAGSGSGPASGAAARGVGPGAEADDLVVDPVIAGTGSEEIWRQRRQKP